MPGKSRADTFAAFTLAEAPLYQDKPKPEAL